MNYLIFIIKSAVDDFAKNKVRTFLTSLGILIGVGSVVLLIAFGLGLKKYIENQFDSLGTNLVIVLPGKIFNNGKFRQGSSVATTVQFDERDFNNIKKIKNASYVVPIFTKAATVKAKTNTELTDVFISNQDIFPTRNLNTQYGNVFSKSDNEKRSKVAVLGPKIAEKLYGSPAAAVGENVSINEQNFKVIGVLESKGGGGFGGPDFDSFIYVPYKSAVNLNPNKKFIGFYIKANNANVIEMIKQEAKQLMLKNNKEDDFSIAEQSEILGAINSIFAVLNTVLIAIACISLVVGGIGIMNIMYVSITERTREIGIRRAIGATRTDILSQFLAESVLLSLLGGFLGLALAYLGVLAVQRFFPAYINLQSILIAVGVSSVIGVVFGVFPARKAAKLSPIEAIRYE